MLVVLKSNYEELSREAARMVANAMRQNPALRLGLATGSTPLGFTANWCECTAKKRSIFLG